MKDMQDSCTQMRGKLDDVAGETAKMIKRTSNYHDKCEANDTRIVIANRFLEKFTLSQDEIHCLTSSNTQVDNTFFDALAHLQRIHSNCEIASYDRATTSRVSQNAAVTAEAYV
ncbi:unnamed protein product [Absidia cylindrospora]